MLASIVMLCLEKSSLNIADNYSNSYALLIISGFLTGLAGWTKNEGLLLILVVTLIIFIKAVKNRSFPLLSYFLLGLMIPGIFIIIFKSLAPSSDLLSGEISQIIAKLTDPARYIIVANALFKQFVFFGHWIVPEIPVLLLFAFLTGFKKHIPFSLYLIITLQLVGYLAIYIITPHDLKWQLNTAFGRNIMQLFPSFLFILFISLENDYVTDN